MVLARSMFLLESLEPSRVRSEQEKTLIWTSQTASDFVNLLCFHPSCSISYFRKVDAVAIQIFHDSDIL